MSESKKQRPGIEKAIQNARQGANHRCMETGSSPKKHARYD